MRSYVLVFVVLIAACGHERMRKPGLPHATAQAPSSMPTQPAAAPEPKGCGIADPDWLRQYAPAEGSILKAFEVSRARRGQIGQHNDDKGALTAAFKRFGCLELPQ